jgi:transposase
LWSEEDAMSGSRLSAGERRRVSNLLQRTNDAHLYRRALAVLEYSRGKSVAEIAESLEVSRQSVYNWIDRFQHHDILELVDAPHPGRPSEWLGEAEALLQALLMQKPEQFGYCATYWTVPLLQEQLWHMTERYYSDSTIRRGLRRLDYVWKRPRYVLAPDPEREKKTANLPRHQWLARAQCVVGRR